MVNPAAGLGRAARGVPAIARALAQVAHVDVVQTTAAGDEARLALAAADASVRALVVMGGDGTVSHAATALARAGATLPIAIIPAGTGNDLHKSLRGAPRDPRALAAWFDAAQPRAIDCGSIADRWFVNAAGVGLDAAVLARTLRTRWPRGPARYIMSALRELAGHRAVPVRGLPSSWHTATPPQRWLTVVVANGQWFGGAFRIAPNAAVDDGQLDLVAIGDASPWRRLRLFADALAGHHLRAQEVRTATLREHTMSLPAPPLLQVDGELVQAASPEIVVRVHPRALRVYG